MHMPTHPQRLAVPACTNTKDAAAEHLAQERAPDGSPRVTLLLLLLLLLLWHWLLLLLLLCCRLPWHGRLLCWLPCAGNDLALIGYL
jgi:hypothetical protein